MNRLVLPIAAALALFAAGCTSAPATEPAHRAITTERLEPYACGDISRLHTLGGVFLASQPSAADFERARQGGVKTVVNLRHTRENTGFDERAVATGAGLAYEHVPFEGPAELTDDVFARVRELLSRADRPILLHCASGNRVGAVWIPWRVLDGGLALEDAVVEARTIGLKSPEYEAKARAYVEKHAR